VKPKTTKRVPGTIDEIVAFLEKECGRVACVVAGLEEMSKLVKADKGVPSDDGKKVVHKMMADNADNVFVQIAGCELINQLALKIGDEGDYIFSSPSFQLGLKAMSNHPSAEMQSIGVELLATLAEHSDDAAAKIGEHNGVQAILSALRASRDDESNAGPMATLCCRALLALASLPANAERLEEEGGIDDVAECMAEYGTEMAKIATDCCQLFFALSASDAIFDKMGDLGVVGYIVKALGDHKENGVLVTAACGALTSLCVEENLAYEVASNDEDIDGIAAIIDAFEEHRANATVLAPICETVQQLCEHQDLCEMLVEKGLTELLAKTKRNCTNEGVVEACSNALEKLMVDDAK